MSKNNNLGITQFYGAAGNAASGTIVGGAQDNGTLRYTVAAGPQAYAPMAGGDGGYAASDPTDPNYFYGEFQWLSLHRSSDGGASSTVFFGGAIPDANGNSNFIAPFILDPNDPNTLLAGGRSLWRTNEREVRESADVCLDQGAERRRHPISAIAVAPGNSDLCWVGHNDGDVYKAVDCTAVSPTWTQVDSNTPGLPNRMVMRLTIDPSDSSGNRVYATFGGFSAGNVWRTADGGAIVDQRERKRRLRAPVRAGARRGNRPGQLERAVRSHRDRGVHERGRRRDVAGPAGRTGQRHCVRVVLDGIRSRRRHVRTGPFQSVRRRWSSVIIRQDLSFERRDGTGDHPGTRTGMAGERRRGGVRVLL